MRTRAKRTTGKQGLRYTPRPGVESQCARGSDHVVSLHHHAISPLVWATAGLGTGRGCATSPGWCWLGGVGVLCGARGAIASVVWALLCVRQATVRHDCAVRAVRPDDAADALVTAPRACRRAQPAPRIVGRLGLQARRRDASCHEPRRRRRRRGLVLLRRPHEAQRLRARAAHDVSERGVPDLVHLRAAATQAHWRPTCRASLAAGSGIRRCR